MKETDMKRISAPTFFAMLLLPVAAFGTRALCAATATSWMFRWTRRWSAPAHPTRVNSTSYGHKQIIYTVTVQLGDMVYTTQSENVLGLGFKPTAYVVNDPAGACVRGDRLVLEHPDGKEYKARIVRRERTKSAEPEPVRAVEQAAFSRRAA